MASTLASGPSYLQVRSVNLSDTETRLTGLDSWNALEQISSALMDAIRAIPNLKHFHIKLLHGKSRALPIFPDLRNRSGTVEQTVAICYIGSKSLEQINFPPRVVQRLKGYNYEMPSIPGVSQDALTELLQQLPPYRTVSLEGFHWLSGKHSLQAFQAMSSIPDFLELKGCTGNFSLIHEKNGRHDLTRLKTFEGSPISGIWTYYRGDFSNVLPSLNEEEEFDREAWGKVFRINGALSSHSSNLQRLEVHERVFEDNWVLDTGHYAQKSATPGPGWHARQADNKLFDLKHRFPQLRSLHVDMLAIEIQYEVSPHV